MFFKMITLENGYELSGNVHYRYFRTSMDYLQKIIASANFRQQRQYKIIPEPFMSIVKKPEESFRSGYCSVQRDRVISTIREAKDAIRKLYIDYDLKTKDEKELVWAAAAERRQECIDTISKMSENECTMYRILCELDKKENRDVSRFVFEVLFGRPNEAFLTMIEKSREPIYELIESPSGDIDIYGIRFEKRRIENVPELPVQAA